MPFQYLPVTILQQVSPVAVQDTRFTARHRRGVAILDLDAMSAGFGAIDSDAGFIEELIERADGVRAAADAGHERIRQAALGFHHLRANLLPDHLLEVAHHHRIRMRPRRGANQVVSRLYVGDPVAQRLVHGVLERAGTGGHRPHLGAQHAHAQHVRPLPLDIRRAHEDDAGQVEFRADSRCRNAVLTGTGLGNNPRLAHALGEKDLAQRIVDLVRAGMIELFALEIDLGAAQVLAQPRREIERGWPPCVMRAQLCHLGDEFGIVLGREVGRLEVADQRHQGFGDVPAAEDAEAAVLVGAVAQ